MNLLTLLSVTALLLVVALPNSLAVGRKKLWKENSAQVLKKTARDLDVADQLAENSEKGVTSWTSSGGHNWLTSTAAETYFSSFSIEWGSSWEATGEGIGSLDLSGATTGELLIVESYVSTYIYSYKHTWQSSGSIITPDGSVSSWTSHYTTYWTSTWTSTSSVTLIESIFSSLWTSCTTGADVWTSTFNSAIWNAGSAQTGDQTWQSEYSTVVVDTWISSYENGWQSTEAHSTSSSWYSVSSSFFTSVLY